MGFVTSILLNRFSFVFFWLFFSPFDVHYSMGFLISIMPPRFFFHFKRLWFNGKRLSRERLGEVVFVVVRNHERETKREHTDKTQQTETDMMIKKDNELKQRDWLGWRQSGFLTSISASSIFVLCFFASNVYDSKQTFIKGEARSRFLSSILSRVI